MTRWAKRQERKSARAQDREEQMAARDEERRRRMAQGAARSTHEMECTT